MEGGLQHKTKIHKLDSGARLLTIDIPNSISVYWSSIFKAGYRFVDVDKYEMPHLAEHLAFEGTQRFPDSLDFKIQVERKGAYYNASTSNQRVAYEFVTIPDDLERIIDLNMGQIQSPIYGEEQIEQQKQVIDKEMNGKKESDGWRLGYYEMHNVMPDMNPDINQRLKSGKEITRADLLEYYREFYGAKNTDFILAGDLSQINLARVITIITKAMKEQHQGIKHAIEPYAFAPKREIIYTYEPFRENQSLFSLRFIRPGEDNATRASRVVMTHMLTGGLSARLGRKAREAGLTYGIGAGSSSGIDGSGISIGSQTNVDKLHDLVEMACAELAAVGCGDFSDEEMQHAVGHMVGGHRRSHQLPGALAGWYAHEFLREKKLESPEDWIDQLEHVGRTDIMEAYAQYAKPENMMLTLIGKDLDKSKADYRKILDLHFS